MNFELRENDINEIKISVMICLIIFLISKDNLTTHIHTHLLDDFPQVKRKIDYLLTCVYYSLTFIPIKSGRDGMMQTNRKVIKKKFEELRKQ